MSCEPFAEHDLLMNILKNIRSLKSEGCATMAFSCGGGGEEA